MTTIESADLPISSADIIEYKPASERVKIAKSLLTLQEARRDGGADGDKAPTKEEKAEIKVKIAEAEQAVAFTEAEQRRSDPIYCIRVPTDRSKAHYNRDVAAEGVVYQDNAVLLKAFDFHAGEIDPDDRAFIKAASERMTGGLFEKDDWPRLHGIALQHPATAKIVSDRSLRVDLSRIHLVRHHLVIEGERSPLPERVYNHLAKTAPLDLRMIHTRITELLAVSTSAAKN